MCSTTWRESAPWEQWRDGDVAEMMISVDCKRRGPSYRIALGDEGGDRDHRGRDTPSISRDIDRWDRCLSNYLSINSKPWEGHHPIDSHGWSDRVINFQQKKSPSSSPGYKEDAFDLHPVLLFWTWSPGSSPVFFQRAESFRAFFKTRWPSVDSSKALVFKRWIYMTFSQWSIQIGYNENTTQLRDLHSQIFPPSLLRFWFLFLLFVLLDSSHDTLYVYQF